MLQSVIYTYNDIRTRSFQPDINLSVTVEQRKISRREVSENLDRQAPPMISDDVGLIKSYSKRNHGEQDDKG